MKKKYFLILLLAIAGSSLFYYNRLGFSDGDILGDFSYSLSESIGGSNSRRLKIIFFDVGQGDSALVIAPSGEQILIDGGPDNSVTQKLGQYLPPYDRKIEYVILTHPHADHLAGLPEILRRYEIGEVIYTGVSHTLPHYEEFLDLIKQKQIKALIIEQPQTLAIGDLQLEFLAPTKSCVSNKPANLNNSSVVFKLTYGSSTALFMGDYEQEEDLLSSSTTLESDILKVGHHGSSNASDKEFLASADPDYAVISVGQDNSFGHPHYRTLYYLKQTGADIFRTDEAGDIIFSCDPSACQKAD